MCEVIYKPEKLDRQTSLECAGIWEIFGDVKWIKSSSSRSVERWSGGEKGRSEKGRGGRKHLLFPGRLLWYSRLDPGFFTPPSVTNEGDGRETRRRDNSRARGGIFNLVLCISFCSISTSYFENLQVFFLRLVMPQASISPIVQLSYDSLHLLRMPNRPFLCNSFSMRPRLNVNRT